jgi:hypothetical protein
MLLEQATYIDAGDLHDTKYNDMEVVIPFYDFNDNEVALSLPNHCAYSFYLYPGDLLKEDTESSLPVLLVSVVAGAFALMLMAFIMFNYFVDRRNKKIAGAAAKFNAVITSLFPDNVRDRLFDHEVSDAKTESRQESNVVGMKSKSKAIADLFPETTIMFADIVGFTAWSSAREPTQVFLLLETLFAAFDEIAKKRNVYKVESIGDCYVAVSGLPKPNKEHAIST